MKRLFAAKPLVGRLIIAFLFAESLPSTIVAKDVPSTVTVRKQDWKRISEDASKFVAMESPAGIFPFDIPIRYMGQNTRLVYAHYFPVWTLSLDNKPLDRDFWALNFENSSHTFTADPNKYLSVGGFFRDRPLSPPKSSSLYWRQRNFAIDIFRAQRVGIDGFIIGIGQAGSGRFWDNDKILCEVASHVAPKFRISMQADLASLGQALTPERLASLLINMSACPAIDRAPDGRPIIFAFAAQLKTPGFWENVLAKLRDRGHPMALVPILLNPNRWLSVFVPFSFGMTYWDAIDPIQEKSPATKKLRRRLSQASAFWLLPVKAQDVRPKDGIFWEAHNTEMFRLTWRQAIDAGVPAVHIITWNDFSENTQIEPSLMEQFLLYDLTAYFTQWYHTGKPPHIKFDAIFYSARDQILDPGRQQDSMRLIGRSPIRNDIEMIALLTAPSTLEITIGDAVYRKEAPAGFNIFVVPAEYGRPIFRIWRGHKLIRAVQAHWTIKRKPRRFSPLYLGGSSTRPFNTLSSQN